MHGATRSTALHWYGGRYRKLVAHAPVVEQLITAALDCLLATAHVVVPDKC